MNKFRSFLFWMKCWFTHPKRQIDQIISGPGIKQLATIVLLFVVILGILYGISFWGWKKENTPAINNEIDSRFWGILAQMLDPGNLHMVGERNEKDTLVLLTNEIIVPSKIITEKPDTLQVIKKGDAGIGTNPSKPISNWLRFFVFLVTVSGSVIFGGLLISTFSNIFERRIDKIKEGLINYRFRIHYVVIGFDQMAIGLIKQLLLKDNRHYVILHSIQNIPDVRKSLFSQLNPKDKRRVIFLHGSRDLASEMKRLRLKRSKEIYILGEPDEYDHDSRNIECYKIIDKQLNVTNSTIKDCHLLFEYPTTFTAFQFLNVFDGGYVNKTRLILFNFYENWARKVFVTNEYITPITNEENINYQSLDHRQTIDENSDLSVHLVIAGMTRMGIAMAIESTRLSHFANHEKKKTRITFIDAAADERENGFANCYSAFYEAVDVFRENVNNGFMEERKGTLPFIDIELEFITGKIESHEIRRKLIQWANDESKMLTVAICFNYPPFSLSEGMYLPKEIYDNEIPVLIRQESSYAIVNMLSKDNNTEKPEKNIKNKYGELKPFGMIDNSFELELYNDFNAKSVNHFYWNCDKKQELISYTPEKINEEWEYIKERDRWSNRFNANSFKTKLKTINWDGSGQLFDEQVELLARMEHARWNVERLIAGFIPANPSEIKQAMQSADLAWEAYRRAGEDHTNEEYKKLKTIHEKEANLLKSKMHHPCIIPYDDLSEYYKNIDRQLVRSIPKILKSNAKLSS